MVVLTMRSIRRQAAQRCYLNFLEENKDKKILFLELGVGYNTPVIIKYPFMKMTYQNRLARYIYFNQEKMVIPTKELEAQTIDLQGDIKETVRAIVHI